MHWRKLGLVFCGDGQRSWMRSHASQPFAENIQGSLFRIYCTVRDELGRSHIAWIEIDIKRPDRVIRISENPVLPLGKLGEFDDAGVMMSCVTVHGRSRYLYYTGWSLRRSVPYHWAIGLAVGDATSAEPSLTKLSGPIIERSPVDPLLCASPHVIAKDGRWRMWYLSGVGWPVVEDAVTPSYNIRYAEGESAISWKREGGVALDLKRNELGFSRPSIFHDGRSYRMWYSVRTRSGPYRLGFASSNDAITWARDDDSIILVRSTNGWDSEMIAYPHVFQHEGNRYMLYCGNGFGRSGFGIAVEE